MSHSVGETVKGVVSGVTDYGAFVLLEDGASGMIHISKLSRGFVSDIHSVIKKGDAVEATVISSSQGKLALSLIGDISECSNRKKPMDFEAMLSSYKSVSEENLAGINSRNKKKRR